MRAKGGTSRVTTAPAAIRDQRPMRTGATQTERAPTDAPSSTTTATASQSSPRFSLPSGLTERGKWSLVNTAAGPTKTPSPSTAGS